MTQAVLKQKLVSLRNCIARIESKKPFLLAELKGNLDLQDIISVNLERATQTCVDLASHLLAEKSGKVPSTMSEAFDLLAGERVISRVTAKNLKKSVGLRNMLVHEYSKIDWRIVHGVCHRHLKTYKQFAKEISK